MTDAVLTTDDYVLYPAGDSAISILIEETFVASMHPDPAVLVRDHDLGSLDGVPIVSLL